MKAIKFLWILPLLLAMGATAPLRAGTGHDHEAAGETAHDHEAETAAAGDGHDHEENGHGDGDAHGHEEEGALRFTPGERAARGILTALAERRALNELVSAPGEVRLNLYRSAKVTPRIAAQIIARHARLGEEVNEGTPLVTLSSVEMAEAQGELLVADREWRRVRKLGRQVVSERRYVEAQVRRQQAYARVRAYGMTDDQIEALLRQGDPSRATGAFDLLSPQSGTVISDDFILGELAEPGRVLFEVTDESVMWVEARLSPEDAARIRTGSVARVSLDGDTWLEGRVVQRHHHLDETTRTQSLRIEIDNHDDLLHAGQFVRVMLQTGRAKPVVAVPRDAVVLMQGSFVVFKVEGDELHPQPVETGVTRAGWTEIRAGLAEGEEIVTRGAFLLKSLLLKSQMGEGHAH